MRVFPTVVLLLPLMIISGTFATEPPILSQEGQRQKSIHDFLFDQFCSDRKTVYRGDGNNRGLKELTIFAKTREIKDGDEIALPAGTERIAVLFRHFGFHGENLDRIKEVHVFPFSPDKAPPRSAQVTDFYRVQMPTIPPSDEDPEPMKIRFIMKEKDAVCRIDDVVFYAQNAISPTFDSIPFRDLGSEHPRERVEIDIDTEHELSIGGSAELQRDRWFRVHETPGSTHESFQNWALERGFLPARGFLKFDPALTKGWGNKPETLKERTDKLGAADLTFFDRYDSGERLRSALPALKEKSFSMCFNDWPEFMSVPLKGRGTPRVEHFDDATDLAAAYVADQIKDAGHTAMWWEVKNESSVKSEWDHHFAKGLDGWGLLADFHNRMADAIHAKSPEVKVGGPSSAYMQFQVKDFTLYKSQARFIEETRGHIDFFSHHFYENAGMLGAHERRGTGYSNYLLGRYEAILDMLRAHMHKVDNVLPILITETGSLQNGREPSDNWLRLLAWNAYLTKSMQRPDQIDMFVPFIFLHMSWNPNSGDAAFTPKAGVDRAFEMKDFEPTTIAHFFDLWQGFDGRRLPVSFERDWLDVVAIFDDNRISLAVTNMGGRQIAVDLSELAKRAESTGATQTRLNYQKGRVVFEAEHAVDAAAIPVDVNETTVIRLTLKSPLEPSGTLRMDRWYAPETAIKSSGESVLFPVAITEPGTVASARLIVGVHRGGGVTEPLVVKVNGNPFTIDIGDANEFSEFFAPLDAALPASILVENNTVEIKAQEGATITSVQIVTHSASPVVAQESAEVDKGKLAYQTNCMACHQVETKIVGPSLVTVAATYPKEKQADFIAWAKAPGKKDPKLMQMPPMGHLPEETLAAIHGFIVEEAKGKVEKKGNHQFQFSKEPERELPYVVRAFLPETSPASVAVVLKNNISVCWDTEACRFRYAWPGSKTRLRQGHTVVDLEGKPFYRETSKRLWSFAEHSKPKFHGYRLQKDGSPEFAYTIGEIEIRERISNGEEPGTFNRHFTLSQAVGEMKLNLNQDTHAGVVADKGELKDGTLTLIGDDTKSFTLTISKP